MYRKGKSHEINDIIDSADATADYSHTNKYYEEVYDTRISNRNDNTTVPNTPASTNTFTNNRFTNNKFRQNNDNASASASASANNIFLKASSQTNLFSSNSNSTKNESCKEQTLSLDNDNFPSLGSTKKTNNVSNVSNVAKTLDFKKIVQTKTNVVQAATAPVPPLHKQVNHSKKISMFQEIRDQSEKYAKVKMYNEFSSDDDGY